MGSLLSKTRSEKKSVELVSVDASTEFAAADREFRYPPPRAFVERMLWLQDKHILVSILVAPPKLEKKTKKEVWTPPDLGLHGLKHGSYVFSEEERSLFGKLQGRRYFYYTN